MTAWERELETESMQNDKLKSSYKTKKELWVWVLFFKKVPPSAFNFYLISSILWCWKNTQDQSQNKAELVLLACSELLETEVPRICVCSQLRWLENLFIFCRFFQTELSMFLTCKLYQNRYFHV